MASFIVISLALNVAHASPVAIRRHAWAAHDYFESVLRCAPGQSLVVFREDVQLFGLWEAQIVRNRRPDIQIIGAGLSSSAWYWDMMQRWPGGPAISLSFKTPAGFHQAIQQGRPFATGFETDVPDSLAQKMIPRGPLRLLGPEMSIWPSTMHDALIVRRISNNNQAHDFFSRDLLSDWAHSFHSEGVLVLNKDPERAERLFRLASRQDIDFPTALTDIAYMRLLKKDYVEAMDYYQQADETYQRLFEKTKVYRSLPAVVDSLNDGWAASLSHQGVTAERMGNIDRARDLYRKSLSIKPNPSAYFNLAVTYWDRDWAQAAQNFDQVLRLDPSHEQAAAYAQIARQRIKGAQ